MPSYNIIGPYILLKNTDIVVIMDRVNYNIQHYFDYPERSIKKKKSQFYIHLSHILFEACESALYDIN